MVNNKGAEPPWPSTFFHWILADANQLLAFASSLMMALTHYGTGTAPIIFGSGYTTLNEWWTAGAVMSVVNLLILVVVGGAFGGPFWATSDALFGMLTAINTRPKSF